MGTDMMNDARPEQTVTPPPVEQSKTKASWKRLFVIIVSTFALTGVGFIIVQSFYDGNRREGRILLVGILVVVGFVLLLRSHFKKPLLKWLKLVALTLLMAGVVAAVVFRFPSPYDTLDRADIEKIQEELNPKGSRGLITPPIGFTGYPSTIQRGVYKWLPIESSYVCFGDVCPGNGGNYLIYNTKFPRAICLLIGGDPIVGYSGWGSNSYSGCEVK